LAGKFFLSHFQLCADRFHVDILRSVDGATGALGSIGVGDRLFEAAADAFGDSAGHGFFLA
jgi:hypothetical protein